MAVSSDEDMPVLAPSQLNGVSPGRTEAAIIMGGFHMHTRDDLQLGPAAAPAPDDLLQLLNSVQQRRGESPSRHEVPNRRARLEPVRRTSGALTRRPLALAAEQPAVSPAELSAAPTTMEILPAPPSVRPHDVSPLPK